jgi:hypothetical protein
MQKRHRFSIGIGRCYAIVVGVSYGMEHLDGPCELSGYSFKMNNIMSASTPNNHH